jgi:hypothetical protein
MALPTDTKATIPRQQEDTAVMRSGVVYTVGGVATCCNNTRTVGRGIFYVVCAEAT